MQYMPNELRCLLFLIFFLWNNSFKTHFIPKLLNIEMQINKNILEKAKFEW